MTTVRGAEIGMTALNWKVKIECVDCGKTYLVENVRTNMDRMEVMLLLLTVPNVCPDCRNLRVVKNP
jgi:hypothetical protein